MNDGTNNASCPRLIEGTLPIREISAESVRDRSLRHGQYLDPASLMGGPDGFKC
jgi:hypothetical protein